MVIRDPYTYTVYYIYTHVYIYQDFSPPIDRALIKEWRKYLGVMMKRLCVHLEDPISYDHE